MREDICHFVNNFNFISQKNNRRDNTIFKFKKKLNSKKINSKLNIAK